jgi:hypothetical protein
MLGVGFTVTIALKIVQVHLSVTGVTTYVAVAAELVLLVKV